MLPVFTYADMIRRLREGAPLTEILPASGAPPRTDMMAGRPIPPRARVPGTRTARGSRPS